MNITKFEHPYIPNAGSDAKEELMMSIGKRNEREIFDMIPDHLLYQKFNLPEPILDEYTLKRHANAILSKNANLNTHLYFLGAGCAPHFIPAVVDEVLGRGEFYTSYSSIMGDQGRGQLQFEYQSMMAELLDMDVIAFPQYDGGSSVGHSFRIACRLTKRKKILIPKSMSNQNYQIAYNYINQIDGKYCELITVDYDKNTGLLDLNDLKSELSEEIAAVFIENPTFSGIVELQAEEIGKMAKAVGAEFIVYADPISLGVIEAPGNYGATIACGDLHSLGIHMLAGAGVGGFVMVKDNSKYAYQLKDMMYAASPTNVEGEIAFSYEAAFDRTSYEIREKSAEYTGTSSGLWTALAGVYLAVMGPKGMSEVGTIIMQNSQYAAKRISEIPNVEIKFGGTFFKEFVVDFTKTGKTVSEINKSLLKKNIIGGYELSKADIELKDCMLVCVTEIHTKADIDKFVNAVKAVVQTGGK
ncbi:MAG: aminomethyl-transferring glycine dehydrogenase subunit GcvPA [Desulfobacterales bacterium]|nr:aminomethyl-transferring glycine dehydrogenase subunit GcvPA [Desulfobacterales bacterium]